MRWRLVRARPVVTAAFVGGIIWPVAATCQTTGGLQASERNFECVVVADRSRTSGDRNLVITAALYDYVREPSALAFAERIATEVFHRAGIALIWVDPCTQPVAPMLYVNVLPDAMANKAPVTDLAMGSALTASKRSYVFFERVSANALAHRLHPNKLLGFVIAHELGHLTLPDGGHTSGVMADHLDLERVRMKGLAFTPTQAKRLAEYARTNGTPRTIRQTDLSARR